MAQVKDGDSVKIHYTGTLTDGTVFDSSANREPLEFTTGAQQVIPGFEKGVVGMEVGEKKTINIPCAEAYGEVNPQMVVDFPKANIPEGMDPKAGEQLQMTAQNGQPINVVVVEVKDDSIKLDANHPLAGKDLTFELELVEIK